MAALTHSRYADSPSSHFLQLSSIPSRLRLPSAVVTHGPLPGRLMAHVLGVSALKFSHPVGVLVLMEANDFLFHGSRA
jgi:hypothetical protein